MSISQQALLSRELRHYGIHSPVKDKLGQGTRTDVFLLDNGEAIKLYKDTFNFGGSWKKSFEDQTKGQTAVNKAVYNSEEFYITTYTHSVMDHQIFDMPIRYEGMAYVAAIRLLPIEGDIFDWFRSEDFMANLGPSAGEVLARFHDMMGDPANYDLPNGDITDAAARKGDPTMRKLHFMAAEKEFGRKPGPMLPMSAADAKLADLLLEKMNERLDRMPPSAHVVLHNDAHFMNLLTDKTGKATGLVDFENLGTGPAAMDFAQLVQPDVQLAAVQAYENMRGSETVDRPLMHMATAVWQLYYSYAINYGVDAEFGRLCRDSVQYAVEQLAATPGFEEFKSLTLYNDWTAFAPYYNAAAPEGKARIPDEMTRPVSMADIITPIRRPA